MMIKIASEYCFHCGEQTDCRVSEIQGGEVWRCDACGQVADYHLDAWDETER